ncbi:hypothetical protein EBX31_13830 [bacterium]|nr:hypothetical protein [bacterium]
MNMAALQHHNRIAGIFSVLLGCVIFGFATTNKGFAGMYYYGSEIGITVNGTTSYYDLQGNQTANPDFNGVNLGTYNLLGGSSLTLIGAKVYVNRDNGSDYINTNNTQTIYWDVGQGSLTTYTAQQILAGGPSGSSTAYIGSNNFTGQNYNLSVNLGADIITSGTYNIGFYLYGNASYDSGGQQYFNMNNYSNNGGANYIATITGYYGATTTGTQASAFTGTGYFNFEVSAAVRWFTLETEETLPTRV